MLPEVKRPGFKVSDSIHIQNLRLDTSSIFVALGDIQCSFYSCAENDTDCGKYFLMKLSLITYIQPYNLF